MMDEHAGKLAAIVLWPGGRPPVKTQQLSSEIDVLTLGLNTGLNKQTISVYQYLVFAEAGSYFTYFFPFKFSNFKYYHHFQLVGSSHNMSKIGLPYFSSGLPVKD